MVLATVQKSSFTQLEHLLLPVLGPRFDPRTNNLPTILRFNHLSSRCLRICRIFGLHGSGRCLLVSLGNLLDIFLVMLHASRVGRPFSVSGDES